MDIKPDESGLERYLKKGLDKATLDILQSRYPDVLELEKALIEASVWVNSRYRIIIEGQQFSPQGANHREAWEVANDSFRRDHGLIEQVVPVVES